MKKIAAAASAILSLFALFWSPTGEAAPITKRIDFELEIVRALGAPPFPPHMVTGSVTITYDPSWLYGVTAPVDAINLTIAGHNYSTPDVKFRFVTNPRTWLVIGAGQDPYTLDYGIDDFWLILDYPGFHYVDFQYVAATNPGALFLPGSQIGDINVFSLPVSEPGTLTLLGAFLCALGLLIRNRREEFDTHVQAAPSVIAAP